MFTSSDFNHVTLLERCFNLKAIKSIEIIFDHIFSLDYQTKFRSNIMKVLPRILAQDRISPNFLQFLRIPNEEENHCCLEIVLKHKDGAPYYLPKK